MPGPGTYNLKSFVDLKSSDNKSFCLGKKELYEYRKIIKMCSF